VLIVGGCVALYASYNIKFREYLKMHIVKPIMDLYKLSYFRCKTLNADNINELGVFGYPVHNIQISDAFSGQYAGVDIAGMSETELRETCKKLHVEVDEKMGEGKLIDAIFGEYCEKHLVQPTFITDYPVSMSPLTKRHRSNPNLTERFELFVCGKELANAYSELNDPIDQLARFEDQLKLKDKGDDEAMYIDMDFVRALEYGMPPTSGMGIGIDRLTMFMTGQTTIQDVLFFPQMRPESYK
jgi:lysyl-tRNA synthetase class 2